MTMRPLADEFFTIEGKRCTKLWVSLWNTVSWQYPLSHCTYSPFNSGASDQHCLFSDGSWRAKGYVLTIYGMNSYMLAGWK